MLDKIKLDFTGKGFLKGLNTFSEDQSCIVCPLSDVFEPLWAVIQCKHSRHVGKKSLGDGGKPQKCITPCCYEEKKKTHPFTLMFVLTCAVQMLLVALSLRMCCSLVCRASRYTSLPAASLKCKYRQILKQTQVRLRDSSFQLSY